MATLATINIPLRSLQADGAGSFTPGARLPAATTSIFVTLAQNSWPLTGGVGLIVSVLLSQDDGATYQAVTTFDVTDVTQGGFTMKDGTVIPPGTFVTAVATPGEGNSLRRAKIFWGAVKAVGLQGSLEARG
jgi:hypothetical protein